MSLPQEGFRLNAPQTGDDMGEQSAPFGGVDVLEHPDKEAEPPKTRTQPPPGTSVRGSERPPQLALILGPNPEKTMSWMKRLITLGILVVVMLIALIAIIAIAFGGEDNEPTQLRDDGGGSKDTLQPSPAPTTDATSESPTLQDITQPTAEPETTLRRIYQRGYLLCGVPINQPGFSESDLVTGERYGFDVDMCRAVAAAIFGEANGRVEYVSNRAFDRFSSLGSGKVDMLSQAVTHTMERNLNEPTTGLTFNFATPYLYNGLQFAGLPRFVACADSLDVTTDDCVDTKICAMDGTTHITVITEAIPGISIVATVESEFLYTNFMQGRCNVIAAEQFTIAEQLLIDRGYEGDYAYGTNILSKEPLAMVTRSDDPEWSDFVNWVMQALLTAEELSISSRTASLMKTTDLFGDLFTDAFRNSITAVGNYAEIYRRHLEDLLPRQLPNTINRGTSGVIYALPFGNALSEGSGPLAGGMIETILDRGHLRCGIARRAIFAEFDTSEQQWSGFDIDFCRAVSAALFNGDTSKVVYRDLPASERFEALENGDVDLLSRLTTVTAGRDIREAKTGVGFSFSQPNMYDGLTFGGVPPFDQCADRLDVTSISCRDLLICVNVGTTFESKLRTLFADRFIVPRFSGELTIEGLVNGQCNVVAGGVVDVSVSSIRSSGYEGLYQTGSNRFSKDPLAMVTRQEDNQWSKFVFWIVSGIFFAEEQGITQERADEMPSIRLFGDRFEDMFQLAVGVVGNYGEIHERHVEDDVPRGGLNLGNPLLSGPQHYPLPGLE